MNLQTLEYVVAVAKEQSFTKAAEKLFISQPSLSQSIARLEQELGTTLFDRTRSSVQPTRAGEAYLAWAQNVLVSQKQMRRQLADISSETHVHLALGISPHLCSYLLPEVLRKFYEEWPNCRIDLEERPSIELYSMLREGRIDLMVERDNKSEFPFAREHLADDHTLLAVPASYPVAEDGAGLRFEMEQVPMISLKRGSQQRARIIETCRVCGFSPEFRLECRSVETAHYMVSMGVGVAFLPELMVKHSPPLSGVRYFSLGNPPEVNSMNLVYRQGEYLSKSARCLVALFKEFYGKIK